MSLADLDELVRAALGADYAVERELTGGGLAKVVVALDNRLGRRVVVKILPRTVVTGEAADRFRREIQFALQLQHPHIVPILSAGDVDGVPYLVMPFVEGDSLRARLASGALDLAETIRTLRGVTLALAFAHARGVVHRDIKPDNVLLSGGSAVVTDFGIAKALVQARGDETVGPGTLTMAGTSLGTPTYMAPEQIVADPLVDHRADLYSVGVLAYEMLAGAPPFTGQSVPQLFAAHLAEVPQPLRERCPEVPRGLGDLIMQCLEKDPDRRPQSAAELAAALDRPDVTSGAYGTPGQSVPHPRATGRRRAALAALVVVGALGLAAVGLSAPLFRSAGSGASLAPAAASAAPVHSVVVLPIAYVGRDSTEAFVASALTEGVTTALGMRGGFRVASRTQAAALQRSIIKGEGAATGLTAYVEGAVYRDGDSLRAALRLVGVRDGMSRWSAVMQAAADRVDVVSAEAATAIQAELARAVPGDTAAPTNRIPP